MLPVLAFLLMRLSAAYAQPGTYLEEIVASEAESGAGYDVVEDVRERLARLRRRPLDLNRASRRELEQSGLFSQFRTVSLLDYRERTGDILSFRELAGIPGFGEEFVRAVRDYVTLGSSAAPGRSSAERSPWSAEALARGRFRAQGEGSPGFSLKAKTVSPYGFSLGAAAGGAPWRASGYLAYFPEKSFVRKVVAGDFNARFAQGAVMWSSMAMRQVASPVGLMRTAFGITPYCSGGTGVKLRGLASEMEFGDVSVSLLGTWGAGLSREAVPYGAGGNATYWAGRFCTGLTCFWHGDGTDVSADCRVQAGRYSLYAEIAYAGKGAVWAGAEGPLSERWSLSLLARYAAEGFAPAAGSPYTTDSSPGNEYALTAVFRRRMGLLPDIVAGTDVAWLPEDRACYARVRCDWNPGLWRAVGGAHWRSSGRVGFSLRGDRRFGVPPEVNADGVTASVRADLSCILQDGSAPAVGRSVSAECGYRIAGRFSYRAAFYVRAALYHCDSWDSRIYVYDRDLYGSMSVPALYGRGVLLSAVAFWKPLRWLKLSFKVSSVQASRPLAANKKAGYTDLKFQCEVRL